MAIFLYCLLNSRAINNGLRLAANGCFCAILSRPEAMSEFGCSVQRTLLPLRLVRLMRPLALKTVPGSSSRVISCGWQLGSGTSSVS